MTKQEQVFRVSQQSVGNLFEAREKMMNEIQIHPFDPKNVFRIDMVNQIDSELWFRENYT
jgi:hypothetical protein